MSQLDTPYCERCLSGETELMEKYQTGYAEVYVYKCHDCGEVFEDDDE